MYSSRIDGLKLGEGDLQGIVYAPVLHVRWQGTPSEDGSGLTPMPQTRPATPPSFPATGPTNFTLDDDGLDPTGREMAVSVRDPGAPGGEGPLFRSD